MGPVVRNATFLVVWGYIVLLKICQQLFIVVGFYKTKFCRQNTFNFSFLVSGKREAKEGRKCWDQNEASWKNGCQNSRWAEKMNGSSAAGFMQHVDFFNHPIRNILNTYYLIFQLVKMHEACEGLCKWASWYLIHNAYCLWL